MDPINTEFAVIQNDECTYVSDLASFRDYREELEEEEYGDDNFAAVVPPSSEIQTKSLYGRTSEQLKLLTAYQDVLHTHQSRKVILHGVSGSGKTALINSIRDPIIQNGGYFVTGKFFQGADLHEPHSAIVAAFSDICDLVAQSEDLSEMEMTKIQDELVTDGQILKRFISNLSPFLSKGSTDVDYADDNFVDYRKESTLAQFKVACKVFLRVMASEKHPIVIFIDDIQWMDDGSKDLIHTLLMKDINLKHVMIILSYRDEEQNAVLDLVQSSSISFVDIPLGNLDFSSVHQIVTEVLASNSSDIRDLSNVIMEKSNGNPLHVMLFLETIQRQKLLVLNERGNSWIFDIEEIQDAVHMSGSFSDLLSRKIAVASLDTVDVLRIAAVIGYSFETSVLLAVYFKVRSKAFSSADDRDAKDSINQLVNDSLSDALQLGFLVTSSAEGMYAFTHDKIQSAFQALNAADYTSDLHFRIGEVHSERGYDGINMYNTAVHWNAASNYLKGRYHKPKLARINLEAAKYCHEKAAFARAATLLRKGLSLIDKHERWESKYFELTIKIVEMLAKMELVIGNFDACKGITENAVSHVKSVERKINFLLIDVEARMTAFESDSALESAVNALNYLGIQMPVKVTFRHVVGKLCSTKLYLRSMADEDILSLPMMTDKAMSAAVRILVLMCTYCLLNNKICQAMYSALLAIRLTTKHGLSPYSANAFAIYGVAEIALRNYDKGYRFGQLALKLGDLVKSRDAECATMAFTLTFLSFWKDSIHDLKDVLLRSGTSGYEVGDIMYATYCISQSFMMQLFLGSNLKALEESFRSFYDRTREIGQNAMILWLKPYLQSILNQQNCEGDWNSIAILNGEIMKEEEFLKEVDEAGNPVLKVVTYLLKAELAEKFENFRLAETLYALIERTGRSIRFSHGVVPWWGSAGHAYYRMYLLYRKRIHLRKARMYRSRLEKLVSLGCQNASSSVAYLHATDASVHGTISNSELLTIFSQDIAVVSKFCHAKMEASIHEEAGFACLRRDLQSEALQFFQSSLQIQKTLGALAKYHWLKEKLLQHSISL